MTAERTIDLDYLRESHDCSLFIDGNVIYLESGESAGGNEVSWPMARRFRKNLNILLHAVMESGDKDPIIIDIDSPGGDVVPGMSIFDAVRACTHPMTGYVSGEACSMACVVLQAFKDRVLAPNALVMYHAGSTGMEKAGQEFRNAAEAEIAYGQKVDDLVYARVLERQPQLSRVAFDLAVMKGLYFTNPADAIAYGLADRIQEPSQSLRR